MLYEGDDELEIFLSPAERIWGEMHQCGEHVVTCRGIAYDVRDHRREGSYAVLKRHVCWRPRMTPLPPSRTDPRPN